MLIKFFHHIRHKLLPFLGGNVKPMDFLDGVPEIIHAVIEHGKAARVKNEFFAFRAVNAVFAAEFGIRAAAEQMEPVRYFLFAKMLRHYKGATVLAAVRAWCAAFGLFQHLPQWQGFSPVAVFGFTPTTKIPHEASR